MTTREEAAIAAAAAANHLDLPGRRRHATSPSSKAISTTTQRRRLAAFLADPLLQTATWDVPGDDDDAVEIAFHPGVTDAAADAIVHAATQLGVPVTAAATGRRIEFPPGCDGTTIDALLRRVIANPVIERWAPHRIEPVFHPGSDDSPRRRGRRRSAASTTTASPPSTPNDRSPSIPRSCASSATTSPQRGRDPTDVELETLAQTWSEHCAHKTFRAAITVDGTEITPLLHQLRDTTERIGAKFVRSAFVGNAGIVSFTEGETLALKAETHNHPSAVEPFGGANTGVGGVIRDVLGAGHRPIAVTDVLCFGPADLAPESLPEGTLHPQRIRQGVVAGVADYGNKIGLPTVAGAVLYDREFTTNPLVFCGCIGSAAEREPPTGPHPGDRIILLGGATGRDGIRGATFSSAAMDATTGEVAGASVQIGDPVTEKLLIDVLDGAEHLWTAITDCGAGGLSSAIGEMAERLGADVELDAVPLKYPGLAAVGDLAVRGPGTDGPRRRSRRRRASCAGAASSTASTSPTSASSPEPATSSSARSGTPVLDLPTGFLHDGRPQRRMTAVAAVAAEPRRRPPRRRPGGDAARPARPPEHRLEGGGRPSLRPRDRRGDAGAAARRRPTTRATPTASSSPTRRTTTGSPSASASTRGTGCTTPRRWPPSPSTRRSATSWPSAPTPIVSPCSTTSRGATPGTRPRSARSPPPSPAVAPPPRRSAPRSCRARTRSTTPTPAATARRHAVPPTLVITAVAHVPDVEPVRHTRAGEPRQRSRAPRRRPASTSPAATSICSPVPTARRSPAPASPPQLDPASPAQVPGPAPGDSRRPRRGLPRRQRRGPRRRPRRDVHRVPASAMAIDALPHADVTAALFSESAGRLVVEVAAERRRHARRRSSDRSTCSAR